jgi:Phosphodiester glycosidase
MNSTNNLRREPNEPATDLPISRRRALIGLGSALVLPTALGRASATAASKTSPTTTARVTTRPTKTAAVVTDTSYSSSTAKVSIQRVATGSGDDALVMFIADVVLADARALRGGFAQNKYGLNIIANTSTIAAANNAVFAINGDYYGFRDSGILIRNGVVYRDKGPRPGLAQYKDGSMRIYDESQTSGAQLLKAGAWNTLSFGPALVVDGDIPAGVDNVEIDTNFGNHSVQGSHPRTGVGMISANHYLFIVVDGRARGYSRGVTMSEFGGIFAGLGAQTAYNLDGGGSSTMWFNGKVVNNPLGKGRERGTSDILYIAG